MLTTYFVIIGENVKLVALLGKEKWRYLNRQRRNKSNNQILS